MKNNIKIIIGIFVLLLFAILSEVFFADKNKTKTDKKSHLKAFYDESLDKCFVEYGARFSNNYSFTYIPCDSTVLNEIKKQK